LIFMIKSPMAQSQSTCLVFSFVVVFVNQRLFALFDTLPVSDRSCVPDHVSSKD
jgi:hypothetical protein